MTEQIEKQTCNTCQSVTEKRCFTCKYYLNMDYCRDVCRRKDRYAPAIDSCPECGREWTR